MLFVNKLLLYTFKRWVISIIIISLLLTAPTRRTNFVGRAFFFFWIPYWEHEFSLQYFTVLHINFCCIMLSRGMGKIRVNHIVIRYIHIKFEIICESETTISISICSNTNLFTLRRRRRSRCCSSECRLKCTNHKSSWSERLEWQLQLCVSTLTYKLNSTVRM